MAPFRLQHFKQMHLIDENGNPLSSRGKNTMEFRYQANRDANYPRTQLFQEGIPGSMRQYPVSMFKTAQLYSDERRGVVEKHQEGLQSQEEEKLLDEEEQSPEQLEEASPDVGQGEDDVNESPSESKRRPKSARDTRDTDDASVASDGSF
jgi:hypothetical protein